MAPLRSKVTTQWVVEPSRRVLDRAAQQTFSSFLASPHGQRDLKVPWNQNWSCLGVSINMLVLRLSVCSKTVTKFPFRRYKHSKLAVRHFRQNGFSLTSHRTSSSHQTFCPIKCSQEHKAPAPHTINRRWGHGWDRLLVTCSFSCTVNGT